jgi:dipeptide/tripeptide permease
VPASWFQSVNPAAILVFAPVFAALWMHLGRRGWEPATPVKMALGLALLGLGFVPMVLAGARVDQGVPASPLWLIAAYLLHTWGELALSPIGLSLVTKLAPLKFASLLMGVWFLANAAANKLAGTLSALMPGSHSPSPAAFQSWQSCRVRVLLFRSRYPPVPDLAPSEPHDTRPRLAVRFLAVDLASRVNDNSSRLSRSSPVSHGECER